MSIFEKMLKNIINFYKNCYITDRASSFIRNIFSQSIENIYFLEKKDDLSSGFLPYQPIEEKYAQEAGKKLAIAEKEKELVLCTLFVVANVDENKYCSPLIIYPAKIITIDELPFIQIDKEHRNINTSVFSEIINENIDLNILYEELFNCLQNNDLQNAEINQIAQTLKKHIKHINVDAIYTFPDILDEKNLKAEIDNKDNNPTTIKVLPASCFAITKKSVNTRGIINELNYLSTFDIFSETLKCVFLQKDYKQANTTPMGYYPAFLSSNQQKVLQYTSAYPFSVIIGPPGTGKSFTIANLAIEKMSIGKSVLIVSGTDKAVDIIAEKITHLIDMLEIIVRAGRKEYKKQLLEYLERILYYSTQNLQKQKNIRKLLRMIKRQNLKINIIPSQNNNTKIEKLTKQFNKLSQKHIKWGNYIFENQQNNSFICKIKKQNIKKQIFKKNNINITLKKIEQQTNSLNTTTVEFLKAFYLNNLKLTLDKHRNHITLLTKALRTNRGTKKEELFDNIDFSLILKVFPIWLVKLSDLAQALPLVNELFDYVIIDEATQCDIASSIPAIYRAKKLIITGDPKQLRHFSFLAQAKQRVFRQKFNLQNIDINLVDYKNNSLLDIVMNNCKFANQFHFLDEHFRSLPAIINFSNNKFYNNKLRIMTYRPDFAPLEGIEIIQTEGTRLKNGTNKQEAEIIIEHLQKIIDNQKQINNDLAYSIGVISPFTDQVEYIRKLVEQNFSLTQIQKHRISIETPYGFQGDERDIIFLSFSVDNSSNALAFRYTNKEDVFNVTITRARKKQYLVISVDFKQLKFESLLRQYLENFETIKTPKHTDTGKDLFANQIIETLKAKNYQVWENYQIAGINVDIVYNKNQKLYGIDLIGYPGMYNDAIGTQRYKILARAGLTVDVISYPQWFFDKEKIQKEL